MRVSSFVREDIPGGYSYLYLQSPVYHVTIIIDLNINRLEFNQ